MKLSDTLALPLDCGGHGRCGRCKVRVSGRLSPLTAAEQSLLSQEEIQAGYRLACQCEIEGPYEITEASATDDAMQICTHFLTPMPTGTYTPQDPLGAAIDVGTTTLAAYWYNLETGTLVAQKAIPNPQRIFGADVISRIEKAGAGQLPQLSACLRQAVLRLLPPHYERLVITGNTVMLYLLCGYDPAPLAMPPFSLDHAFGLRHDAVYFPPCFSAYIGADIATAIWAAGLFSGGQVTAEKPALLLDAGTNGEIIVAAGGRLWGCSAAAGPAFEGSQISRGMPSVPGAICHVHADFSYETIAHAPARGYCGSGILDMTARLLDCGALDAQGLLTSWPNSDLPALTQDDIRQIQLAKAAIAAGCESLLHAAGVTQLDTLYLSGGFGSELNVKSAQRIGLIPPARRVVSLGNGAAYGASLLLLHPEWLDDFCAMRSVFTVVELGNDPRFADAFIQHMTWEDYHGRK